MGEVRVPADARWAAQTQRAVENFQVSGLTMPRGFIRGLGLVKWAASAANLGLGLLNAKHATAIQAAALICSLIKYSTAFTSWLVMPSISFILAACPASNVATSESRNTVVSAESAGSSVIPDS